MEECSWWEDGDGTWTSDCDYVFEFNDGGPFKNGWKFCPKCGKPLKEISFIEEPIEEEAVEEK